MIKITVKMPSTVDLMRTAMAEVEKQITKAAQAAAAPHGGVRVRFDRKSDGSIRNVAFEGSESAIEAAKAVVAN